MKEQKKKNKKQSDEAAVEEEEEEYIKEVVLKINLSLNKWFEPDRIDGSAISFF